jgi:hypothetical protein
MNMSLTTDAGRGDLDHIFPLFLPVQRKRKKHTGKHREGQSMRQSVRQRGCWEIDMRDERAMARPPWNHRNPS